MNDQSQLPEQQDEGQWISISDMMAGLMVIFLFVALSFMLDAQEKKNKIEVDRDRIKEIAVTYQRLQNDLYDDLYQEFEGDLEEWDASIDKPTLSVRFHAPDVLFKHASAELQDPFIGILNDFFPRYIRILAQDKYRDDIEEIRIEGHTSSKWGDFLPNKAYIRNMKLSQDRTRSVLEHVLNTVPSERKWTQKHLTANGLSSSKLRFKNDSNEDKIEDEDQSRRVEFRVRTNAENRIVRIIQEGGIAE
ncbi:MAG: OmpA family protein [Candidatus Poribacteria bacterium]|nr:OmpA family protein [Candidatus Poribacteria bacterium]